MGQPMGRHDVKLTCVDHKLLLKRNYRLQQRFSAALDYFRQEQHMRSRRPVSPDKACYSSVHGVSVLRALLRFLFKLLSPTMQNFNLSGANLWYKERVGCRALDFRLVYIGRMSKRRDVCRISVAMMHCMSSTEHGRLPPLPSFV